MPIVYKNWLVKVETFNDRISGKEETRIYESDIAVILPVLQDGKILFEKHYRPVIGKTILELPAGHINRGESPFKAAKRELLEETGYAANRMRYAFKAYMSPGLLTSITYFFIAAGLKRIGEQTDASEKLTLEALSTGKAYSYIKSKRIIDGKSIAGVLYYKTIIGGQPSYDL